MAPTRLVALLLWRASSLPRRSRVVAIVAGTELGGIVSEERGEHLLLQREARELHWERFYE